MNRQTFTYYTTKTGHEHLYNFGLINMNGRMYDPEFATFLSPDNYVQDPTSQQSFNRYAYCMYNPLKYVDPTGERYYGYSEAYIYKLMEEIQKNVFREWYSVYETSMASNILTALLAGNLFSQGLGENGGSGNHGCGGGDGNQNGSSGNGHGDGNPTNNSTNSNYIQDEAAKHLVSPNYLWIKCHFWYLYCNRQDMHVDATKINFDFLSFDDLTPVGNGNYTINLYDYISECPQLAAALGEITLIPAGDDYYNIHFDTYDFDLHRNKDGEWLTERNAATLFGGLGFYGVIDNHQVFPSPSMFFWR